MRTTVSSVVLAAAALLGERMLGRCQSSFSPDALADSITTDKLRTTLTALNDIAYQNGGNRAFGLPGYKASVDYILSRAQGPKVNAWASSFTSYYGHTTKEAKLVGPDGETLNGTVFASKGVYNSPATPVPDGFTAPLILVPENSTHGNGCAQDQWDGIDATGKIVLLKGQWLENSGGNNVTFELCNHQVKLRFAKKANALGVVFYNRPLSYYPPGVPYQAGLNIEVQSMNDVVPVVETAWDIGLPWAERIKAGETLTVTMLVDAQFDYRESWNVFAETEAGDSENVVMIGAHLDSVEAGPGINDNGSGSGAVLEILDAVRSLDLTDMKQKLRFAWWGTEERGMVGSLNYTGSLSDAELDKIRYYFNYDMIGSPIPIYEVTRDENSGIGATKLMDRLHAAGKTNATYGNFNWNSDHIAFTTKGIPSAALFTGSRWNQDPNYHQRGDNITNIHWDAYTINAKAAGHVLGQLALSLDGVPPRNPPSVAAEQAMLKRGQLQFDERHKHGTTMRRH